MFTSLHWLLLGIALIVFEVMTPGGLVLLFFGAGALVTAAVAAFAPGLPLWVQCVIFSVVSIVSLVTLRKMLCRTFSGRSEVTGDIDDDFSGKRAVVSQPIAPDTPGKVEFNGTNWTAVADAAIETGVPVRIVRRTNLTLHVERLA